MPMPWKILGKTHGTLTINDQHYCSIPHSMVIDQFNQYNIYYMDDCTMYVTTSTSARTFSLPTTDPIDTLTKNAPESVYVGKVAKSSGTLKVTAHWDRICSEKEQGIQN